MLKPATASAAYAGLKEAGLAAIIAWLRTVPLLP